ncbi:M3 family oligoendopeptidase [Fusibacter ferrireducens]|uniref:Oligoendopeptidase F family protein n=1 Tax=Fusibacter ferrireducens TaxID=2785058 RepID=A0ABR9ZRX0_9FIRM|nr:M3 family oligoendopeptidase [Fusibacter ferrireducens]MBF4693081.1 oligoendopeptidase F family protein [Fusibacter ferrireducens]
MSIDLSKSIRKSIGLTLILLLILNTCSFATEHPTQWHLEKIFADTTEFNANAENLNRELIPKLMNFKGQLSDPKQLEACLTLYLEASILSDKLYVYASMLQDTNTANSDYQEYVSTAMDAYANLEEAAAFINPELMTYTDDELIHLSKKRQFQPFESFFLSLVDERAHVLTEEAENVLAYATEFSEMPKKIYDQLTTSDVHYDDFLDPLGDTRRFDFDIDTIYFYSNQLDDRVKANDAYAKPYSQHANTIASIYIAEVQKNIFLAKSRGYDSVLEYATSGIIEPDQYRNLIETTRANAQLIQQFNHIKQKSLGYEEFHSSDFHLPYASSYYQEISYEDSIRSVIDALAPLGDQYTAKLNLFLESGNIDVYPDEFKTNSQYTWGAYDAPVYILLNYSDDFISESTLAHELGHAMHQMYTIENQNYFDTNVGSFPSEATSTLNELLLLESLKNKADDDELKLFYLEKEIELYYETFFMQTILADFEMRVYDEAEKGNPLSLDRLNTLWLETSEDYYGNSVILDDAYQYQWMQIPHMYQTFYVYSYAMSLAASTAIKDHLITEGDAYQKKYLDFLKSGSSLSPVTQMANLEIDLDSTKFYSTLFTHFEGLLGEMDQTLESLKYYDKHPALDYLYSPSEIKMAYKEYYATQKANADSEASDDPSDLDAGASEDFDDDFYVALGISIIISIIILFLYSIFITVLYVSKSKRLKRLEHELLHSPRRYESFDDRY